MTETAQQTAADSMQEQGAAGLAQAEPKAANHADNLTAAEKAYFAGRGERELPEAAETPLPRETEAADERSSRAKTVPLGALHAEREEHKKTRAELQKMRAQALEWQRELAGRQGQDYGQKNAAAELSAGQSLPPKQEGGQMPPDPREDFLGFARWQGQEISRLSQELNTREQREREESRAQAAETAIMQEWDNAVSGLRHEVADIDEALDFLEEARLSQLDVLAAVDPRFADKKFCARQIGAELRDIIISSFQQGKNPAAAVYDIARAYGYGQSTSDKIGKLKQALPGARSLTAGGGNEAGDPFLLERVANLPEADFAKWYEKNRGSFRRMFGG